MDYSQYYPNPNREEVDAIENLKVKSPPTNPVKSNPIAPANKSSANADPEPKQPSTKTSRRKKPEVIKNGDEE